MIDFAAPPLPASLPDFSLEPHRIASAFGRHPNFNRSNEFARRRLSDMHAIGGNQFSGRKVEAGPWLGHPPESHLLDRLARGGIHDGGDDTHCSAAIVISSVSSTVRLGVFHARACGGIRRLCEIDLLADIPCPRSARHCVTFADRKIPCFVQGVSPLYGPVSSHFPERSPARSVTFRFGFSCRPCGARNAGLTRMKNAQGSAVETRLLIVQDKRHLGPCRKVFSGRVPHERSARSKGR